MNEEDETTLVEAIIAATTPEDRGRLALRWGNRMMRAATLDRIRSIIAENEQSNPDRSLDAALALRFLESARSTSVEEAVQSERRRLQEILQSLERFLHTGTYASHLILRQFRVYLLDPDAIRRLRLIVAELAEQQATPDQRENTIARQLKLQLVMDASTLGLRAATSRYAKAVRTLLGTDIIHQTRYTILQTIGCLGLGSCMLSSLAFFFVARGRTTLVAIAISLACMLIGYGLSTVRSEFLIQRSLKALRDAGERQSLS